MVRQAPSAAAGSYGPVRSTDTLWSLASKHRPSSRVTVYQTMVAIYDKNPRSFADGNINHILVGSRILLPSAAEAGRITDAEARRRFNSDNASWKGLSPKYLAEKQPHPVATKPAASAPVKAVAKAAPLPTAAPKVSAPQAATEVTAIAKAAVPVASTVAPTAAPAPLPVSTATVVGKPSTEMALALEDANAQLGQVTEMNHRLKLRLQALTEEVETLKAQLQDQTALQKEVAELKAKPVPPVVAPEPKQNWVMELLSAPITAPWTKVPAPACARKFPTGGSPIKHRAAPNRVGMALSRKLCLSWMLSPWVLHPLTGSNHRYSLLIRSALMSGLSWV